LHTNRFWNVGNTFRIFVSETYAIEDCFKAQSSESSRTSTYTSDTGIQVFNNLDWTTDDFLVEFEAKYNGAGVAIGIEPSTYLPTMKQHITNGVNGTGTYMMYWVGKETSGETGYIAQSSTSLNTYIPMKIEKTGNTIKLYYNDVLKETLNISYLNSKTWTFIWSEWKSGTIYMFKNLKIKPL